VDEETNCPAWCVADHAVEDEGVARHRAAIIDMPIVSPNGGGELMVELHSTAGETTAWVYIGDGVEHSIELSRESTARLARVLRELPP